MVLRCLPLRKGNANDTKNHNSSKVHIITSLGACEAKDYRNEISSTKPRQIIHLPKVILSRWDLTDDLWDRDDHLSLAGVIVEGGGANGGIVMAVSVVENSEVPNSTVLVQGDTAVVVVV